MYASRLLRLLRSRAAPLGDERTSPAPVGSASPRINSPPGLAPSPPKTQADIVVRVDLRGLVARSPGFSPVDRDLPQPDGIYFEPHWGRRFVGTAGPISAASRDVFQPDIGKSWARMTPNFRRPTGTLAECGCRFNFRIPFQVTPSQPAWE